ncbi:MAG: hypothetical protein WCE32_10645, partial [Pseudolabrys sp.]
PRRLHHRTKSADRRRQLQRRILKTYVLKQDLPLEINALAKSRKPGQHPPLPKVGDHFGGHWVICFRMLIRGPMP